MPHKTITIRADHYQYPTKDERKAIYKAEPLVRNFGFRQINPIVAILMGEKSIEQTYQLDNLYWWDDCLQHRLKNLSHAHINSIVHFERGIPDDINDFEEQNYINRVQFDFYAETYYYFFGAVMDNIGQILNVYYALHIKETNVHFKKVTDKLTDTNVQKVLREFLSNIRRTIDYRHSFTHRYIPSCPDNRSGLESIDGQSTFYSASGRFVNSRHFRDNIMESQQKLFGLLDGLRPLLLSKR